MDGCQVQTGLSCNKSQKTDFFQTTWGKIYYKGASEGPGDPHHWKTIYKCNEGNKLSTNYRNQTHVVLWCLTPEMGPKILETVKCRDFLFPLYMTFQFSHQNSEATAASMAFMVLKPMGTMPLCMWNKIKARVWIKMV